MLPVDFGSNYKEESAQFLYESRSLPVNTSFIKELEKRELNYLGGVAKNRKVKVINNSELKEEIRLDKLASSLPTEAFSAINLNTEKPRTVYVATLPVEINRLEGVKVVAIVMNAPNFEEADDIDCLLTNEEASLATPTWVIETYSQRNWIEVFYREAKCYLGLREYQVRDKKSLERHFILGFCAYTFILWHKLTGSLRRHWANKPLKTFPQALEAFRTAISDRFVAWLDKNRDVFAAYKA